MIKFLNLFKNQRGFFGILLFCVVFLSVPLVIRGAESFVERVKGKIYLQVQSAGEAWYVNPANGKRYYLGRPADAFNIMRTLGIGITNSDLARIPVYDSATEELDQLADSVDSYLADVDDALADLDSIDEGADVIDF